MVDIICAAVRTHATKSMSTAQLLWEISSHTEGTLTFWCWWFCWSPPTSHWSPRCVPYQNRQPPDGAASCGTPSWVETSSSESWRWKIKLWPHLWSRCTVQGTNSQQYIEKMLKKTFISFAYRRIQLTRYCWWTPEGPVPVSEAWFDPWKIIKIIKNP